MVERDPYDLLGVARDASPSELRAAWRRLCTIYHPDRYADAPPDVRAEAEQRMAETNRAYTELRQTPGSRPDTPPTPEPLAPTAPVAPRAPSATQAFEARAPGRSWSARDALRWLAFATLAVVVGIGVVTLIETPDEDSTNRSGGPARSTAAVRSAGLSPLDFPAGACPPDGKVRWITDGFEAAVLDTTDAGPAAFDVRARGSVHNDTDSTINIKPFVELFDASDRKGAVPAMVTFVDAEGNGLTTPPALRPGERMAWQLESAVRMARVDGVDGGRPIRAEPVRDGLTAWHGAACAFSATSVNDD